MVHLSENYFCECNVRQIMFQQLCL